MRFRKGFPEKIGGWVKYLTNPFNGSGRKLLSWTTLDNERLLGIGTRTKLYVQSSASYDDITPIRKVSTNSITFAATNGSSTLTVTDSTNGAVKGDFVTISGAVSLGGLITAAVLNQEYVIDSIVNILIQLLKLLAKDTAGNTVTANSSDTGNGGSGVDGSYQISVGLDVYVPSSGWGTSAWGSGPFGSSSPLNVINQLRLWSMDSFGEDLSC